MSKGIYGFKDETRWLSNFWICRVPVTTIVIGGKLEVVNLTFSATENAYQALKSEDVTDWEQFIAMTPGQTKRNSKDLVMRFGWDSFKDDVMLQLNRIKFFNNADLMRKLLDTGDQHIEETNTWGDTIGVSVKVKTVSERF